MTPLEAASQSARQLVDIRPRTERRDEFGYVPSSLSVPFGDDPQVNAERLAVALDGQAATLICLSGRRSAAALEGMEALQPGLTHVRGGLLGWHAADLPLSGAYGRVSRCSLSDAVTDATSFRRVLMACFVGELAETLAHIGIAAHFDPAKLLRRCFEMEDVAWDAPTHEDLYRVLDRAGAESRRVGTSLACIAANTDRMLVLLDGLALAA